MLGALVATGVAVALIGTALGSSHTTSTVTPQSGPTGRVVVGRHDGATIRRLTSLASADLGGEPALLFSADVADRVQFGIDYVEADWDRSGVASPLQVARILEQSRATVTRDPDEIAATQAALWHVTGHFDLDPANSANRAAVVRRYDELVADATAHPAAASPPTGLELDDLSTVGSTRQPARLGVGGEAPFPWTIDLSDHTATLHRVTDDGVCDTSQVLLTVSRPSTICVTPGPDSRDVEVVVRSAATTVHAGRAFRHNGRSTLIMANRFTAQSAAEVTIHWG